MKKNLLLLIPIFIFLSCKDNDIDLKTSGSLKIRCGEEYAIQASSEYPIVYTSENKICATVSTKGVITGHKVGESNILLTGAYDEKRIKVEVYSTSNLYPDPVLNYSEKKEDVIKRLGTPDVIKDNEIVYTNNVGEAEYIHYVFDYAGYLEYVMVLLPDDLKESSIKHLEDRYFRMSISNENYIYFSEAAIYFYNSYAVVYTANILGITYTCVQYSPLN